MLSVAVLVASVFDVAISVAVAGEGTVAGGVYRTLVVVAALSVPHVGWQLVVVPVLTSVQATPGVTVPSFATVAFTVTGVAPGAMVPIGLVMVTAIAATAMVMLSVEVLVASVFDVAISVAVAGDGTVAGGV
jgi:hypothetical protein